MSRRLSWVLIGVAVAMMLAHRKEAPPQQPKPAQNTFTIFADSELRDIDQALKGDITQATGLSLNFSYNDTPGGRSQADALWVPQSKYPVHTAILAQEKTMLSPVVLGLNAQKAHELGWDTNNPDWTEIAAAARAGKFTFGMANPATSNTGLSAAIGLAAAFAKNPDALTAADLNNPQLPEFFRSQQLTAGSSGSLVRAYESDPSRVDGIINYESALLSLNARARLPQPLTLIYPKEGIITADYPLLLLNDARRADYQKLIAYLRGTDFQTKMSARTLRRPINPDAITAAAIPRRTLIELPFPADPALIPALLDTFFSGVRVPGASRYVLDLSSSMQGARLASLKQAMLMLASQTPGDDDRYARFLNREEIGIITFSSQPAPTVLFPMGVDLRANEKARAAIEHFVEPLQAQQSTAIYSSVKQALSELEQERASENGNHYYTVVLMTDGENNRGITHSDFNDWYKQQGALVRGIPVFPILFGEGNAAELQELAQLTGGKLFDARTKGLPAVFKEIRAYQ